MGRAPCFDAGAIPPGASCWRPICIIWHSTIKGFSAAIGGPAAAAVARATLATWATAIEGRGVSTTCASTPGTAGSARSLRREGYAACSWWRIVWSKEYRSHREESGPTACKNNSIPQRGERAYYSSWQKSGPTAGKILFWTFRAGGRRTGPKRLR